MSQHRCRDRIILEKAPIPLGTRGYTRDFETCRNIVGLCILAIMSLFIMMPFAPCLRGALGQTILQNAIRSFSSSIILRHYSHLSRILTKRSMRFRVFLFFSRNVLLTCAGENSRHVRIGKSSVFFCKHRENVLS